MEHEIMAPDHHIEFHVIAYDNQKYGDNRGRVFKNGDEAVAYAQSLEPRFHAQVIKHVYVPPEKIWDYKDNK